MEELQFRESAQSAEQKFLELNQINNHTKNFGIFCRVLKIIKKQGVICPLFLAVTTTQKRMNNLINITRTVDNDYFYLFNTFNVIKEKNVKL